MAQLFIPDRARLISIGFEAIADIPALFDDSHRYCREYNWFLRERALGEWTPKERPEAFRTAAFLSPQSVLSLGYQLKNWIEWCAARQIDWRTADYRRDLLSWRNAMASGIWSEDGSPLSASTCERRVDVAIQFLNWAAKRGLRSSLKVPMGSYTVTVASRTGRSVRQKRHRRAGRRRADPASLRLPTDTEIQTWRSVVEARCGHSKWLTCRFILETGCRLAEATNLRADDIPPPSEWHVDGSEITIRLIHGTKGGKERVICMPVTLAKALDDYKNGRRMSAIAKARRLDRTRLIPAEMFLSDFDGRTFSEKTVERAWQTGAPYKGYSPHLGRHAWACLTLIDHLKTQIGLARLRALPEAMFFEIGHTAIETLIKPQLGHVSTATTIRYLRWVMRALAITDVATSWHALLDQQGNI